MAWAAFLAAIAGSLAKRVLAAIGIGVLTFAGFTALKTQFDSLITGYLGSMIGSVYQILALGGIVDSIGIWAGAVTTVISVTALKKLAMVQS
jgi:hypothetical protein